jgi:hypothetical protein
MNYDKIKELAEQAGYLPDMFNRGHWDLPECHKFAELIIQECLEKLSGLIVEETFENLEAIDPWLKWNQALGHAALEIEEHFYGVEE